MSGGWQSPSIAQGAEILHKINAAEPVARFGGQAALHVLPLPFYGKGTVLARVRKPLPAAPAQYYVMLPQEAIPLDGSVANIHAANAAAPLALTSDNIVLYLAFRLYFGSAALLQDAQCTRHGDIWQAAARVQDAAGTYETTLWISPRGEVSEDGREPCGETALAALPPFTFGQV